MIFKRLLSGVCIIALITPAAVVYAQDEIVPEEKPEEPKIVDTAPDIGDVQEFGKIDSVDITEAEPESLVIAPPVVQADVVTHEPEMELQPYGFKGTGRDIVIGAVVLGGWLFVAYLAANQKSD